MSDIAGVEKLYCMDSLSASTSTPPSLESHYII